MASNVPSKNKNKILSIITPGLITALFFPLTVIYYEILFKISVGAPFFCAGTILMLLYSFFAGGIVWLLSTLSKKAWLNRVIGSILLMILSIPYLVQYFVFKAFKIFYDINTLTGGAGDALTGFAEDVKRLVLSFDGISKIILYFLPALFLLFAGYFFGICRPITGNKRMLTLSFSLEACLFAVILNAFVPAFAVMQKEQYNFQNAVENFGLLRGMRLDITSGSTNLENADFEKVTSIADMNIAPVPNKNETLPESDSDEEKPTHITDRNTRREGSNALDIDYLSLGGADKYKKLNSYVASLTPSNKNPYTGLFEGKNLIMITAEAFSAEAIDPELTPTLYRMATKGINFTDYYQPASAGTTGGEYQNIFGFLPMEGGRSFKNTQKQFNYLTIGSQLDRLGYYGKAYHNNDYKYYDRHLTHVNLGYSDGYMGYGNGIEEFVTKRWPQSDLEMLQGTLPTYIDKQPFSIYYMTVSGHGIYSKNGNAMSKKNWSRVEHLEGSEPVLGYYAANLELEDAMTYLIDELEKAGIADDTVICISSDHFPYGLEDKDLTELYGYQASDNFKRDHSRLILWCG